MSYDKIFENAGRLMGKIERELQVGDVALKFDRRGQHFRYQVTTKIDGKLFCYEHCVTFDYLDDTRVLDSLAHEICVKFGQTVRCASRD